MVSDSFFKFDTLTNVEVEVVRVILKPEDVEIDAFSTCFAFY
jgi:hypothetical protein